MKLVFSLIVTSFAVSTLCDNNSTAQTDVEEGAFVLSEQDVDTAKDADQLTKSIDEVLSKGSRRHKRDICDGRRKAGWSALCAKGHVLCIQFCRQEGCKGGYCANKRTCYCNSGDNF